jgi:hypothetical protein
MVDSLPHRYLDLDQHANGVFMPARIEMQSRQARFFIGRTKIRQYRYDVRI